MSIAIASPTSPMASVGRTGLSSRRKAAMIVQIMMSEGKNLSLKGLPEHVQLNLARELGALRIIDRTTMHSVAEEFSDLLESIGLSAPGTIEGALDALSDQISPEAAAKLKSEEAARLVAHDPWARIFALEPDDLVPIMQDESTEVAAVVLSKLPVSKAAELLGLLPGEQARRITFAVSKTSGIRPETVTRIGRALAQAYCMKPVPAFTGEAEVRIGAILDSSDPSIRDAVLEGLGKEDPDFAELVRKSIFTFADISTRIKPVDVPNITRAVSTEVLTTAMTFALALGGNDAEAAEYILSNMSQRMADQLREEIGDLGKIKKSVGEDAMKDVISNIRIAIGAGQITLIETDEEEEE